MRGDAACALRSNPPMQLTNWARWATPVPGYATYHDGRGPSRIWNASRKRLAICPVRS